MEIVTTHLSEETFLDQVFELSEHLLQILFLCFHEKSGHAHLLLLELNPLHGCTVDLAIQSQGLCGRAEQVYKLNRRSQIFSGRLSHMDHIPTACPN